MTKQTTTKRLPKSQRAHIRRMKQIARKEGTVYNLRQVRRTPAKTTSG